MTDVLTAFGYRAPSIEEVKATIGFTLEDSVRMLTKQRVPEVQIPAIVKLYRELHDTMAEPSVKLFDGVTTLLEELPSHGIQSVLVSNKGRNGLDRLLERLRIWAFFDLVLSAEDVEHHKPNPELYLRHIVPEFAKIGRTETLVIGDAEIDIRFAKSAGLSSCWAKYGYGDAAKCRALHPDYEFGQVKELRNILCGGGKA